MDFKPSDKTIKDLLGSGHQFMIPRFQRAYSWEKRHSSEFFSDIVGNLVIEDGSIVASPYFVGTMLFIGNFIDADHKPIVVVDGQQRLTTITIMFSALSELFKKQSKDTLAEQIFKYIMTKDDNGESLTILSSKGNYPYFAYHIQDYDKKQASTIKAKTEEEKCIKTTYDFFLASLSEANLKKMLKMRLGAMQVDALKYVDILKAIRDQVLSCSFISIATETKEQANRIFEILNAKGKRLDNVDLIKNKLFEVLNDTQPVDVAEDLWTKTRGLLEDEDVGVGIATFYRHFWTSTYKKSTGSHLYDDFKKIIKPKSKDVYLDFMNNMYIHAQYYVKILNPKSSDFGNRQEYLWLIQSLKDLTNDLNIVQVRVPLLALLDAKQRDVISAHVLKKTVQYLEGFHFAYSVLTSGRSNKIDTAYSLFAIDLHSSVSKSQTKEIADKLIDTLNPMFPDYNVFKDAFVKLSFSAKNPGASSVLTRYALRRLNCYYAKNEILPIGLTVEHIFPESKGPQYLNIGNLILLERQLNEAADDMDYSAKVPIYSKSKLIWVENFIKEHSDWIDSDIKGRAEKLSNDYYYGVLNREAPKDDNSKGTTE